MFYEQINSKRIKIISESQIFKHFSLQKPQDALYLPESEIWTPRYSVYNAMNTRAISKGRDSDVRIESDGRVEQSGYFFSKVLCFDHIQNFPFDKTSCGLVMSSSINMSVMRLTVVRAAFTTVRGNEEFTPTNYSAMYSLPNDPAMDNEIQLLITFQRNSVYFIIVVVIPATLVTILTVTGVLLPVSPNGDFDPVNIGLTSLLALSITLTVVADNLPRTIKVPLLGSFVLSCLAICVIAIFFGITFAKFKQLAKKPKIDLKAISTVFKGDQVVEIKRGRKRAIVRAIIKWLSIALFIFLQSALICNLLIFFSHTWREEKIDPFENYNQTDWEKFSVNFWNEHFSTYINCTFYSQNL
ncbi:unnamed protein product, partial [Mesorhabditis belari]|uniref:Neurotransmitter-gated ion-channel ligand-binding domain-containing protein n=1 Tax=Mesorhabditis belari TaxID=2138241 RepID=A0AAF3EY60_9BILA